MNASDNTGHVGQTKGGAPAPSKFWSPLVHSLAPYIPGEQVSDGRLIKLNTNENPYPPSASVFAAIQETLGSDGEKLRLYPDPASLGLRQAAADRHGLSVNQVFAG
ncbi:MAG: hypothetical protein ACO3TQ_04215, partial [Burkholderiaceae bacterium]